MNTLGKYIIDENGFVVECDDLMKWARWLEAHKFDSQLIDTIAGIRVSTVFLALDHNYYGGGEPVLWETMIFNDDEVQSTKIFGREFKFAPDLGQWRFSYKEEAHAFHHNKVKELKAKLAASRTTPNTPTTLI